jgi:hypothetical protein
MENQKGMADQIDALKAELAAATELAECRLDEIRTAADIGQRLHKQLEVAREALDHYADSRNWTQSDFQKGFNLYLGEDGWNVADEAIAKMEDDDGK